MSTECSELYCKGIILANGANYNLHKQLGILKKEPVLGYAYGGLYEEHKVSRQAVYLQPLSKLMITAAGD